MAKEKLGRASAKKVVDISLQGKVGAPAVVAKEAIVSQDFVKHGEVPVSKTSTDVFYQRKVKLEIQDRNLAFRKGTDKRSSANALLINLKGISALSLSFTETEIVSYLKKYIDNVIVQNGGNTNWFDDKTKHTMIQNQEIVVYLDKEEFIIKSSEAFDKTISPLTNTIENIVRYRTPEELEHIFGKFIESDGEDLIFRTSMNIVGEFVLPNSLFGVHESLSKSVIIKNSGLLFNSKSRMADILFTFEQNYLEDLADEETSFLINSKNINIINATYFEGYFKTLFKSMYELEIELVNTSQALALVKGDVYNAVIANGNSGHMLLTPLVKVPAQFIDKYKFDDIPDATLSLLYNKDTINKTSKFNSDKFFRTYPTLRPNQLVSFKKDTNIYFIPNILNIGSKLVIDTIDERFGVNFTSDGTKISFVVNDVNLKPSR